MTAELSPDTRRKLVGVLGMLSSSHAGERDAAAQLATRMVRGAGLTWEAVVVVPRLEAQPEPSRPERRGPGRWMMDPDQRSQPVAGISQKPVRRAHSVRGVLGVFTHGLRPVRRPDAAGGQIEACLAGMAGGWRLRDSGVTALQGRGGY
jgi:hypothetical protein